MALFVIIVGALLMLGGGSSLLAGFDITMTERGSAMTIAGTVALAGGAITVAIGFSLLRLSQILRVLQSDVEDEVETSTTTAVPAAGVAGAAEQISAPAPITPTAPPIEATRADLDDTILTSPLKPKEAIEPPKKPGFFRRSFSTADVGLPKEALATAGIAAAAVVAIPAIAANRTKEALAEHTGMDQEISPHEKGNFSEKEPELITALDLETELSRALAEDIPSTDNPSMNIVEAPILDQQEEITPAEPISFNEGLTQVLSKPKKRGKRDTSGAEAITGKDTSETYIDDLASPFQDNAEQASDAVQPPEVADIEITVEEQQDEVKSSTDIFPHQTTGQNNRPTILGTYNAGNGTYVMYSDGTVEATTEQGVRMFKSMEELRKHLAQA